MSFETALRHTLRFEGGYVNHPNDKGKETFRGISRVSNPDWPGWKLIDQAKTRGACTAKLIDAYFAEEPEMALLVAILYSKNYWMPFVSLEATDRVMAKLFDTAVNVGVGGAVKMLQRAVNELRPGAELSVDGAIGPKTRAGVNRTLAASDGENRFLAAFCRQQAAHYRRIVQRDPSQQIFLNGWLSRAAWLPV